MGRMHENDTLIGEMTRRTYLKAAAVAVASCTRVLAADVDVELSPGEPGPEISPHLYGHFIEHLGGVIYDGVWVGRDSKIPNVGGIRKQFIDDMKRIGAPNLRWPGGCFADGYHWRDGIGGGAKRPRTYNFWQPRMPKGMQATETNQFGIHEFIRLCRLVGAAPYVAGNVGSGTPQEFHDWVSYCNAPAGTVSLADERAANGDREPFAVRFWGVGNEAWGCGGSMRPEEYAQKFRLYTSQFPAYGEPFLIAVGPRGHNPDAGMSWTSGFFDAMRGFRPPDGFGLHYYTDLRPTQVKAATFSAPEWYEVLLRGARMENVLEDHWAVMGKFDPEHRTKLIVDEWGVWYPPGEEITPAYILSQPITLRDAVHTGMHFDIFNRHAGKLAMCNVAQTDNCIHSLFLAQGDKYCRTTVYHVFDMYRPHMGAKLVPAKHSTPSLSVQGIAGAATLPGLSVSASIRERRITATLTNPSLNDALSVRLRGARATEARGTVLTHADMKAANTFAAPETVRPAPLTVRVSGGVVEFTLPAKSVVAVEVVAT